MPITNGSTLFANLPVEIRSQVFGDVFRDYQVADDLGTPSFGYFVNVEADQARSLAIETTIKHLTTENLFYSGSQAEIRDAIAATCFSFSSVSQLQAFRQLEEDYSVQFRSLSIQVRFTHPDYEDDGYDDMLYWKAYSMIKKLLEFPSLSRLTLVLSENLDDEFFLERYSFIDGSIRRIAFKVKQLRDKVNERHVLQIRNSEGQAELADNSFRIMFCGLKQNKGNQSWDLIRTLDLTHLWEEAKEADYDQLQKIGVWKAIVRDLHANFHGPSDIPPGLKEKEEEMSKKIGWKYEGPESDLEGINRALISLWSMQDHVNSSRTRPEMDGPVDASYAPEDRILKPFKGEE